LLDETAARVPNHIAIHEPNHELSYRELAEQSAAVASCLRELGVRRGDRVGIYAKKSARTIVAIYGILRAGAAYVPLDPSAPLARIAYTIENAGIRVLVGSQSLLSGIGRRTSGVVARSRADRGSNISIDSGMHLESAIVLDSDLSERDRDALESEASGFRVRLDWSEVRKSRLASHPASSTGIDTDLAYILYTSGSTGTPKGVAIDHRASLTFVSWAVRRFELGSHDRVTSHAPLHFDLSTFDVLASVAAGSTIVIVPENTAVFPARLAELLERERITVTYLVPSALSMMAEHGDLARRDLSHLRAVLFAGEVFPIKYLRTWLGHATGARFYNLYGPTETNVCTYHEVDRDDARCRDEPVSIGASIDNVDAFVVSEDGLVLTKPGEIGELWVRGACLARGYFGDPEKTARGFVRSPIQSGVDEVAYRTGDRVAIEPDGRSFRYLGRLDHQIKTRGYRVELGEIESALAAHPAVTLVAAVPIPDAMIGHRIALFAELADGAKVTTEEVAAFSAARLPRYMVPESIEFVSKMPLTSSGKVDRQALANRISKNSDA
jgi:amino acid adenylation domain-containing protein